MAHERLEKDSACPIHFSTPLVAWPCTCLVDASWLDSGVAWAELLGVWTTFGAHVSRRLSTNTTQASSSASYARAAKQLIRKKNQDLIISTKSLSRTPQKLRSSLHATAVSAQGLGIPNSVSRPHRLSCRRPSTPLSSIPPRLTRHEGQKEPQRAAPVATFVRSQ